KKHLPPAIQNLGGSFRPAFHHPVWEENRLEQIDRAPSFPIDHVILKSVGQFVMDDLFELIIGALHGYGDAVLENFRESSDAFPQDLGRDVGFLEFQWRGVNEDRDLSFRDEIEGLAGLEEIIFSDIRRRLSEGFAGLVIIDLEMVRFDDLPMMVGMVADLIGAEPQILGSGRNTDQKKKDPEGVSAREELERGLHSDPSKDRK